jgi:hypothetical protein
MTNDGHHASLETESAVDIVLEREKMALSRAP